MWPKKGAINFSEIVSHDESTEEDRDELVQSSARGVIYICMWYSCLHTEEACLCAAIFKSLEVPIGASQVDVDLVWMMMMRSRDTVVRFFFFDSLKDKNYFE